MFALPVSDSGLSAEVPIRDKGTASSRLKERFWAKIAKRVPLQGRGSHITKGPYLLDLEKDLSPVPARTEAMVERFEAHAEMFVILKEEAMRDLRLYRHVESELKEITPQFFLRNVSRVERDANPRRVPIRYAVWREDPEEWEYTDRIPRIERPELIEELSMVWVKKITYEINQNVHNTAWGERAFKDVPMPRPVHPSFMKGSKRIPIDSLSLEPAKAQRATKDELNVQTIRSLDDLFDGSKDDDEAPA